MARSRTVSVTWLALLLVAALATLANAASSASTANSHTALNSLTSINTSVFAALLIGTLAVTESAARDTVASSPPLLMRRVVGAHGRATALLGLVSAVLFAAIVTAIAVAVLALRGASLPPAHGVIGYVEREAIAAARLAVIGVAIGTVCRQRRTAIVVVIAFVALNGVLEAASPVFRNWGPIGVLNAFSDPTHLHQFSVGTGGLIAMAWALLALIAADLIAEAQHRRRTVPTHRD
jgi:ABC-2 type transport system permease protein